MGGDGSMADVINTFVLRAQREANNDVNRRDVKVKPVDVKLGILPAGLLRNYFVKSIVCQRDENSVKRTSS